MMITVGWLKDLLAVVAFSVLILMIWRHDIHLHKRLAIGLVSVGLIIDLVFSVYPALHCKVLHRSTAS